MDLHRNSERDEEAFKPQRHAQVRLSGPWLKYPEPARLPGKVNGRGQNTVVTDGVEGAQGGSICLRVGEI